MCRKNGVVRLFGNQPSLPKRQYETQLSACGNYRWVGDGYGKMRAKVEVKMH